MRGFLEHLVYAVDIVVCLLEDVRESGRTPSSSVFLSFGIASAASSINDALVDLLIFVWCFINEGRLGRGV